MAEVARAAGAESVTNVTSVEGAVLVPAVGSTPAKKVDVNGAELFDNVISFNNGTATISYAFGIQTISVNADGKSVVTAKVDKIPSANQDDVELTDATTPTFKEGVEVKLCNGNVVLDTTTIEESPSMVTIVTDATYDTIFNPPAVAQDEGESATPSTPSSQTLQLTIKAAK
jgi:hypothetical protein